MDLLVPTKVTGIITQGAKDFGHVQFVGSYKLAYSNDGEHWTVYQDEKQRKDKVSYPCGWWGAEVKNPVISKFEQMTCLYIHTENTCCMYWKRMLREKPQKDCEAVCGYVAKAEDTGKRISGNIFYIISYLSSSNVMFSWYISTAIGA